jgi:hypothetical protein
VVGKPRQTFLGLGKDTEGNDTVGNLEAANVVNTYYVKKVQKIRTGTRGVDKRCPQRSTTSRDKDTRGNIFDRPKSTFSFTFAIAGKIAKVISGLEATAALATDGIPVSPHSRWAPKSWAAPSCTW